MTPPLLLVSIQERPFDVSYLRFVNETLILFQSDF